MRDEELFVARSLLSHLGKPADSQVHEGDDPPDFEFDLDGRRIGVEVTRLSQMTIAKDGTLGRRETEDAFALSLLEKLDIEVGPLLPKDCNLVVTLTMPVSNANRFRKHLFSWVQEIAKSAVPGQELVKVIDGFPVQVTVIPERPEGKRIVGLVTNSHSSADIGFNARCILEDRIRTKHDLCVGLPRPIWLALLNDYWLADADSYLGAYSQLDLEHCFERVYAVSHSGHVQRISRAA